MNEPPFAATLGPSTRCAWGGEDEAPPARATVMPVFHGVTFAYDDLDEWRAVRAGERPGHGPSGNGRENSGPDDPAVLRR